MESVYLETTIASYLTARPSGNLVAAARQQLTYQWWEQCRSKYDLYISKVVILEAIKGDPDASEKSLKLISSIPELAINEDCLELAESFFSHADLPESARNDALHAAIATYHQVDFLLTWNCRYLANAHFIKKLLAITDRRGLILTHICTPEELMGGE